MGQYKANTAIGVSEVIAFELSSRTKGTCSANAEDAITAPRGLRVGATIVGPEGAPILSVFELDYRVRLDDAPNPVGPPARPGAIKSSLYAAAGALLLTRAVQRGAKSTMAKVQLAMALVALVALMLTAVVAVVAGLVAAGIAPSAVVDSTFGENATATFTIFGIAAVGLWAAMRKRLLAIAAVTQQAMHYLTDDRHRDTVAGTVDDAIDGLRDDGWQGDIHLLAYSFGSLVVFDALFPKVTSLEQKQTVTTVSSLTTVDCPIDVVRLFFPKYGDGRMVRDPSPHWENIFNAADVFGSNLQDGDDAAEGERTFVVALDAPVVRSRRYLDEALTPLQILMVKGFTTHGGYWGEPNEASCFTPFVDRWIAPQTARVA